VASTEVLRPVWVHQRPRYVRGFVLGLVQPAGWLVLGFSRPARWQPSSIVAALSPVLGAVPTSNHVDALEVLVDCMAHWIAGLQRSNGLVVSDTYWFGNRRSLRDGSVLLDVALPCGRSLALESALDLVVSAVLRAFDDPGGVAVDTAADLAVLARLLEPLREPGQNTNFFLKAAFKLNIPAVRLAPQCYRFGEGRRQRIFQSTLSDRTTAIGTGLARNKVVTAQLIRSAGLPGPTHRLAKDAEEAVRIAQELSYPVVVKPADCDGGRGVSADLCQSSDVHRAFMDAAQHSQNVLVERHVDGIGHRLTVIEGRVVKVTAKRPWGITGNGTDPVHVLVARSADAVHAQAVPPHVQRKPVGMDDEARSLLKQYGLGPEDVPAADRFVPLRRQNNASAGGSTTVLDLADVHPDNLRLAVRAADALLLDIAGIDLILADIKRSWMDQTALICEVNAQPQTDAQTIESLLASSLPDNGRIPVTVVLTPGGATGAGHETGLLGLARAHGADGWSSQAGVWQKGTRIAPAFESGFAAARVLMTQQDVASALMMISVEDVSRHGLPVVAFDRLILSGDVNAPEEATLALEPESLVGRANELTQRVRGIWPASGLSLLQLCLFLIAPMGVGVKVRAAD
jgi:cyanophycin synthetase